MKKLRVVIFNVQHGFCAQVRSPNGYGLLYDCGKADKFSPVEHIRQNEQLVRFNNFPLAQLIVSHPHDDHIEDIDLLTKHLAPAILHRQTYSWQEIKTGDTKEEYENLDSYSEWQKSYNQEVASWPDWGMGVEIGPSLTPEQAKLLPGNFVNNSSVPLFITYKGWKIAFPGDLEKAGWLELLKKNEFRQKLAGTNFFIASHHGHSSGYCQEIFQTMGKPAINIVSVHSRDESVDPAYSSPANSQGINWYGQIRHMLTTRKDGSVVIEVDEHGIAACYAQQFQDNVVTASARSYRIW